MPTTRKHFSAHLDDLHQELLKMGTLVEDILRKAVVALKTQNREMAVEIIDDDMAINSFENTIQDRGIILLATEQPVASDLRVIVTAIKIAHQLERIGDHAVHIAKSAMKLSSETYMKPLADIPRMADICISMIRDILTALMENDQDAAIGIARRDDMVDELYRMISGDMRSIMKSNGSTIGQGIELSFVTHFLERIGDHVTNIAELVVYSASGKRVELNR